MTAKHFPAGAAAAALVLSATPLFAHHSFAMFDQTRTTVLNGVVKEFQWTNPHIWIEVMAPDAKGKTVQWSIEGGATSGLRRSGWSRESFKPGEKVAITIYPLKNGDNGGSFVKAQFADGRTLGGIGAGPNLAPPIIPGGPKRD